LDDKVDKYYVLMFLNFEEEDILSSIDYIVVKNKKFIRSFTFNLEKVAIKNNLENFVDEMKKNFIKIVIISFKLFFL
jgi:hypothetical protein